MLTGIGFQWWVLPVGLVAWLVLWFGNFSVIEDGIGLLGMVTLSFVVAAWRLHPDPARSRAASFRRCPITTSPATRSSPSALSAPRSARIC